MDRRTRIPAHRFPLAVAPKPAWPSVDSGARELASHTTRQAGQVDTPLSSSSSDGNHIAANAPSGVIYFVRAGETGAIKIGYTSRPIEQRMAMLQTGSAARLRLLATIPANQSVERRFHLAFADLRIGGEWFEPHDDLLHCVAGMCGASLQAPASTAVLIRSSNDDQSGDDGEDAIGRWFAAHCVVDPLAAVSRHDLYAAWAEWCREHGENPGAPKQLKRKMRYLMRIHRLRDTQIGNRRLNGYAGLRLRSIPTRSAEAA